MINTKVKVLILRVAGTNCEYETKFAFELCGAHVDCLHINKLIVTKTKMFEYDILVLPGGFSYGDDISSGKVLANELKNILGDQIRKFALSGKPIIGICNGFQVLVKMGLLPYSDRCDQVSTLYYNDSGQFECRWIYLRIEQESNCIWTKNLPNIITLPVAHGEGKFIPINIQLIDDLNINHQVVLRYSSQDGNIPDYPLNPNGSISRIAGICNKQGNVFGLMPHPERYVLALQHPVRNNVKEEYGYGKIVFQNAVNFCK
ncbi:MAG: phosphoribosylformylglycinamidine synthase I [Endomicrobium sp.]|jgi:phosphoribosylformylglycinamidine synthase|nr:phosphoribosylformylglycinamidine synthase I [Endomicrobium sp.]